MHIFNAQQGKNIFFWQNIHLKDDRANFFLQKQRSFCKCISASILSDKAQIAQFDQYHKNIKTRMRWMTHMVPPKN